MVRFTMHDILGGLVRLYAHPTHTIRISSVTLSSYSAGHGEHAFVFIHLNYQGNIHYWCTDVSAHNRWGPIFALLTAIGASVKNLHFTDGSQPMVRSEGLNPVIHHVRRCVERQRVREREQHTFYLLG